MTGKDDILKRLQYAKSAQDAYEKQEVALDAATQQETDAEKKHADAEADFITFVISGAGGLVSKCRIPVGAVATRGLFRILLGTVSDVKSKSIDPGFEYTPADFNDGAAFSNFSGNSNRRVDPGFQFSDADFKQPNGSPY
jgi:hypothetical protein